MKKTPFELLLVVLFLSSSTLCRSLLQPANVNNSFLTPQTPLSPPQPPMISPRIIGGELVKNGEAPYQVALLRHGSFTCGGVWIDSKRVLTAAHCVDGFETRPHLFRIRYATLYRNGGLELPVSRIIRHPNYSLSSYDYDVAVLCTETPFTAGVNAQVVSISRNPPVSGTRAISTGWGRVHAAAGTQLPLFLQRASNLTVMGEQECQKHLPELTITSRMLCAISLVQAVCTGDSGGPLINAATGQLMGITSWGSSFCLHPSHPGVFARLYTLRSWILAACAQADSDATTSTVERLRPALSVISMTVVAFNPLLRVADLNEKLSELLSWW